MNYTPTDFRTALELDMARHEMLEKDLGARLGVSQQSISKWKARNFPPLYRVKELLEVFGPDSYIAKLDLPNMLAKTPRIRIAIPGTTPTQVTPAAKFPSASHIVAVRNAAGINIRTALPERLIEFAGALGPTVDSKHLKVEYCSPNLAAYVKQGQRHTPLASTAVLTLSAARAEDMAKGITNRRYALALILDEGVSPADVAHPSVLACATALGVEVWACPDINDVSARIQAIEREGESNLPPQDFDDFETMGGLLS